MLFKKHRNSWLSTSKVANYSWNKAIFDYHLIKIYPMALVFLSPHGPLLPGFPIPNPIKESQVMQSFSLLPRIPILALAKWAVYALNPSLLQLACKVASEPSSVFHLLRPSDVGRYCPSAISEYREFAGWSMAIKVVRLLPGIFIPRQILVNGVLQ